MSCLCDLTNPIAQCVDAIQVGVIADASTDVLVYITEIITGRIKELEATSDEDGLVTIDTSDMLDFFSPNFIYDLRITDTDQVPIEFTIDGSDPLPCVQVPFIPGDSTLSILSLA